MPVLVEFRPFKQSRSLTSARVAIFANPRRSLISIHVPNATPGVIAGRKPLGGTGYAFLGTAERRQRAGTRARRGSLERPDDADRKPRGGWCDDDKSCGCCASVVCVVVCPPSVLRTKYFESRAPAAHPFKAQGAKDASLSPWWGFRLVVVHVSLSGLLFCVGVEGGAISCILSREGVGLLSYLYVTFSFSW